jgi:hypothetical protein
MPKVFKLLLFLSLNSTIMNSTQPPNEEVDPASSTPPSSSDTAPASSTSIPIDITMFQTLEARATELSQQLAEAVQQLGLHMNKASNFSLNRNHGD